MVVYLSLFQHLAMTIGLTRMADLMLDCGCWLRPCWKMRDVTSIVSFVRVNGPKRRQNWKKLRVAVAVIDKFMSAPQ